MNNNIFIVFSVMCLISVFGSVYNVISSDAMVNPRGYLEINYFDSTKLFFINFFSWVLNLSNLVPISLLVTLELVKMV